MSTIFGNDLFSSPRAATGGLRVELFTASQCGAARRRHALMRTPARRIVPGLGVAVAHGVAVAEHRWYGRAAMRSRRSAGPLRQDQQKKASARRDEHFG
jgi:hypothetical protein